MLESRRLQGLYAMAVEIRKTIFVTFRVRSVRTLGRALRLDMVTWDRYKYAARVLLSGERLRSLTEFLGNLRNAD